MEKELFLPNKKAGTIQRLSRQEKLSFLPAGGGPRMQAQPADQLRTYTFMVREPICSHPLYVS